MPSISDYFGRKWPYFICILVQTMAYIVIFYSKNIYMTIGMYLVVGLCSGGRVPIGTSLMNEFVPTKYQNACLTLLNVLDSVTMVFQALYYSVDKNWQPLHFFGICSAVVILALIMFIPESPKYLYSKGRFQEAKEVLA